MYEATIEVKFDAAHRLLDYEGKCRFCHGHSYVAIVCVGNLELTPSGFVIDFGDLKRIVKRWIEANWDHTTILNKRDSLVDALTKIAEDWADEALVRKGYIPKDGSGVFVMDDDPTAERMAKLLFDVVAKECTESADPLISALFVRYVTIKETATSWATYRPYRLGR